MRFEESLIDSLGYKIPEQIDDDLMGQIVAERSYIGDNEWYYELVTIKEIYEYEYNSEKLTGKDVFFDINAKKHTYVGSHGAYEG